MRIWREVDIAPLTTIGISATVKALVQLQGEGDRDAFLRLAQEEGSVYALGKGSNIVPGRDRIPYVLLSIVPSYPPYLLEEDGERAVVRVHGGTLLRSLLLWCRRRGLWGLEHLAGIPGTIGGAIFMNAGSFGVTISQVISRIRVWGPSLGDRWIERDGFSFGYRSLSVSGEEGPYLIWEAEAIFKKGDRKEITQRFRDAYMRKRSTQPVTLKTCGCLFKNPEGTSAGYLLDRAGLKGLRIGGVKLSEMHANFLINMGGGRPSHVRDLIYVARERVLDRFGYLLEMEAKILE